MRRLQSEAIQKLRHPRSFVQETLNKEGTDDMKRTILTIACALVAPLAFAQTGTTTEQTTTTNPTTTATERTTTTEGTVTRFEPRKRIVVRREGVPEPISFVIGKTAHYVNKAGREIDEHLIRPGTRVIVKGERHVAKRVVVDED